MSQIRYIILAFCVFILAMAACDDNSNLDPFYKEPYVIIDFKADATLRLTKIVWDTAKSRLDTCQKYLDSAKRKGNDTTVLSIKRDSLSEIFTEVDAYFTIIKSGKVTLDTLYAEGGKNVIVEEDTVIDSYHFPLDMNTDSSKFIFKYDQGITDTILFTYTRSLRESLNEVLMEIHDLKIKWHTVDSISNPKCDKDNCISNEITYTIYF